MFGLREKLIIILRPNKVKYIRVKEIEEHKKLCEALVETVQNKQQYILKLLQL